MKVLQGRTLGYKHHPQLTRFKATNNPLGAIACYLRHVADEAQKRGYHFDGSKIIRKRFYGRMHVTEGQAEYEFKHLLGKLKSRNPERAERLKKVKVIELHPMMQKVGGSMEDWEII